MKTVSRIIPLVLGLSLLPLAQLAGQDTMQDQPTSAAELTLPTAVRIVEPIIAWEHVGESVQMVFTIRKDGRPTRVHSREAYPEAWQLAEKLKQIIPKWRFDPARDDMGQPAEVTAILPVRVVAQQEKARVVAQLELLKD